MNECWYALALALLSTDYYTPEVAFEVLNTGVKQKFRPIDNDLADMIEMHKTMNCAEIAKLYGMDRVTVWRKITKKSDRVHGNRTLTSEDIEDMIRLKEIMTYKQIGDMHGISAGAVYNRIKRFKGIIKG